MKTTEFYHPSHHHKLTLEDDKGSYRCDGCKELGSGARYRCEDCNYDLHKDCALAQPSKSHRFYKKSWFEFLEQGESGRICDACIGDVHGFVYHCRKTGLDMHPCCSTLPPILQAGGVELVLKKSLSFQCDVCRMKEIWKGFEGWSYRSTDGEYEFHVSCVKKMLKADNWEEYFSAEREIVSLYGKGSKLHLQLQKAKGKMSKWWEMAKLMIQIIISAIIGDPTAIIGTLFVQSFLPK